MTKLFKKKNNKKGFTLIELIISVAILTIVMGMIMGALSPIFARYESGTDYLEASDMAKNAAKYIKVVAKTGTDVYLSDADDKTFDNGSGLAKNYDNAIFAENGRLYRRDTFDGTAKDVYGDAYYEEYSINIVFTANKVELVALVVKMDITITNKETGKVSATHTESFEVMNTYAVEINTSATEFTHLLFNLPAPEGVPDTP